MPIVVAAPACNVVARGAGQPTAKLYTAANGIKGSGRRVEASEVLPAPADRRSYIIDRAAEFVSSAEVYVAAIGDCKSIVAVFCTVRLVFIVSTTSVSTDLA